MGFYCDMQMMHPAIKYSENMNNNKIFNAFPGLIQTLEGDPLNNQPEDNSYSVELIPSDNEDADSFVDALEQQSQQIRVIGPRHPKLISSDINSKNILLFHRRQPRTNLIKQMCSVPKLFEEAMKSSNKDKWCLAIQREILNINKLNVWTLRDKTSNNHSITKRLDYQNTLEPTGRLLSLRTLISFTSINKYEFHRMDVHSAFLNAPLQEEICLEIPQGVEGNTKTQLLHLNKALYGLKQASLAWYRHLSDWIISSGFHCSLANPCIFWRKGEFLIWIYIHIDNLAIFGPNLDSFKKEIKKDFDIKDLGEAHLLLGIKVTHLHDGFSLDQEHYITELAKKYEINKLTPSNSPFKPHLQLLKASDK
ncbi:hypothetical protein O181_021491 [Austropuccinia psidii MF-1]|uniref:Reverse transcriptase Ty1/copia-type domain-containing protein n=1 Tax=Austropuccinia psidii MF-1 TaxID=1389203 RepID=A0A9Q3CFK7_9BASI|nr:hypothetical protein [Austropuccinia psidii MF-1]